MLLDCVLHLAVEILHVCLQFFNKLTKEAESTHKFLMHTYLYFGIILRDKIFSQLFYSDNTFTITNTTSGTAVCPGIGHIRYDI